MGEVYRAHDTKLGRDVAIKVLPESFARDPERMARFEREAQVLASLNHPHVATIHGLEESNGVHALVMELVEGPTLAERIGGRAMPLDEVLPIAKQIAEGLEYAHEKGVVHRDLKPANVKLTTDGNVRILDFGLAKALEAPVAAGNPSISPTLALSATQAGVILGTAAYMAPEQARGAIVDKRADIWAFDVVLYEMLTGKQPFAGETVSDTLAGVLKTEPQWDTIPVGMRRLVRRCLEKHPKRRLRDIGEARVVIEDILAGSAEEQPASAAKASRFSKALRFTPWVLVALLALVLSATWLLRPKPANSQLVHFELSAPEGNSFGGQNFNRYAISPDGKRLAFVAVTADGKRNLWLRLLESPHADRLPGTEGATALFWSPDSRWVAFSASGKLMKIDVTGGLPQVICDGNGVGTWNREGVILFQDANGSIRRVSASGGEPISVLPMDVSRKESAQWNPQFLPDGRQFLYFSSASQSGFALAGCGNTGETSYALMI
jgi:eukaryotic-like serine/threonine-protein kinase